MNKRSVGSIYEQLAAEQLINMGYSVLACNYRNRFGEIDIIACLLYTSPSPRDRQKSRMPSSA